MVQPLVALSLLVAAVLGASGTWSHAPVVAPPSVAARPATTLAQDATLAQTPALAPAAAPATAAAPRARLLPGTTLAASVPVVVSWATTPQPASLDRYELQQNQSGVGWEDVARPGVRGSSVRLAVRRNADVRHALRAVDASGRAGDWVAGPALRAQVIAENAGRLIYRGRWTRTTSPSYDGRFARSTRSAGASVTYTFVGQGFAWVSAKSPVRGLARVYVDGKLAATVSTYAGTPIARRVVFARNWDRDGRHTVRIVALGTPGHPRVDVDAFIVLAEASRPIPAPTPATAPTAPTVPLGLSATPGDGTAVLTWRAPAGDGGASIKGYNIYRDGVFIETIGTRLQYTATGLRNGTAYRFAVSAWNSAGGGTHTADVTVTPRATSGSGFTDLPGWRLVFADEFNTDIPRGSFVAATAGRYLVFTKGWRDTSRNGTYSPEIIAVQNGVLDIAMGTVNGVRRVAAMTALPEGAVSDEGDLLGLRVELRIRADRMVGYKGVPLLWPMSDHWPHDGEINFPESNFDINPRAYMHRMGASSPSDQDVYFTPGSTSWQDWHTYVIEWIPGKSCEFFLDGVSIGRSTRRVPTTPMHFNLQFETQLSGGPPAPGVSGHVQVDRVAIWAMD